jgi:hypothetical protein
MLVVYTGKEVTRQSALTLHCVPQCTLAVRRYKNSKPTAIIITTKTTIITKMY